MAYKDEVGSLDRIASALESMGGGGGDLPATTPEDSGKYLGVDNSGDWELSTPSGGGGCILVVEVKLNESNMYYLDITAGELNNAFESGKVVYVHFEDESGDSYCIMISKDEDKTGSAPGKYIYAFYSNSKILFFATDENSYPVMHQ